VRYLGIDYGHRRIGLALSDPSAILASPWDTMAGGGSPAASAALVGQRITAFLESHPDEPIHAVVVGLPRRLNGDDNGETPKVRQFVERLRAVTGLTVYLEDERLTSREADERLGVRERDWRRRKPKLDAAAAAVILQDFLDRPRGENMAPAGT